MAQVDYPQAIPMFVDEQRVFIDQNTHYAIVIHKTACNGNCSAQDVANFFANDPAMASTHYVVGQDGTVVQCVLEKDGAGGNGVIEPGYDPFWQPFVDAGINPNVVTISIEHCDPTTDNSTPLTSPQQQASFALVQYLVQKYSVPLTHIKGHNTIAPQDRAQCPGNYPWQELMSYLQGGALQGGETDMATITVHSTTFLNPNDNDQQVWNVLGKNIPLAPDHAIPQSWLQARWQNGLNFGPPLEPEHECKQYYNSTTSIIEQQFAGARASWHESDGSVTWFDSRGTSLIWYPS